MPPSARPSHSEFTGFPEQALEFWEGLAADNTKVYWQSHKDLYNSAVAEPLAALAETLTSEFGEIKTFRPYRDVRFSKDKSPYQLFASLAGTGTQGTGVLYLQLGLDGLLLAGGYWQPSTDTLSRFRTAITDPATATSFDRALRRLIKTGSS